MRSGGAPFGPGSCNRGGSNGAIVPEGPGPARVSDALAKALIDTGLGIRGDGPTAVYAVLTVPYYAATPHWPHDDGVMRYVEVTLNGS